MSLFIKLRQLKERNKPALRNPLSEIFNNIPTIETERLLLRKITPDDAEDMYEYARSAQVTQYLLWDPHPDLNFTRRYLLHVQEQYRLGNYYDWAIELRADHRMIGTCGFAAIDTDNNCAEVGYVINPQYRGRGIAPEALEQVLTFGFDNLHLHRIHARYLVGNDASRKVMDKCGLQFEGIAAGAILLRGNYRDVGTCAILRNDFQISRAIRMSQNNSAVIISPELQNVQKPLHE